MASSDSDYDYTEDDETEYSDDDEDDDDEEGVEEDDDDSEYSEDEDEDDDDDDEDEDDEEGVAEEEEVEEEAEEESDSDEEYEQMPALEHGEQADPDEILEGPDAPLSGISTPVDCTPEDQQPSLIQTDTKELPLPASTDLAPGVEGTIAVSSLSTDLEKMKLDHPSFP